MAIVLGTYAFSEAGIAVAEKQEEIGGRDARIIQIKGVISGCATVAALETELDTIAAAASDDGEAVVLSLRAGRRFFVRRIAFTREIRRDALAGSFALMLEARDPFEESESLTSVSWPIEVSGAAKVFSSFGNVFAVPSITLVASGTVIAPSFSDSTRSMTYLGELADAQALVFDAGAGRVVLDGNDVTPYTEGFFPRIAPGDTTLTYTDDAESSHTAAVTVAYRDRWW